MRPIWRNWNGARSYSTVGITFESGRKRVSFTCAGLPVSSARPRLLRKFLGLLELEDLQGLVAYADPGGGGDAGDELAERAAVGADAVGAAGGDELRR